MNTTNIAFKQGEIHKTALWQKFTDVEKNGVDAIKDLYEKTFEERWWEIADITDLAMVIYCKLWHWDGTDWVYNRMYEPTWEKMRDWAYDHLKGNDAQYYYNTLSQLD